MALPEGTIYLQVAMDSNLSARDRNQVKIAVEQKVREVDRLNECCNWRNVQNLPAGDGNGHIEPQQIEDYLRNNRLSQLSANLNIRKDDSSSPEVPSDTYWWDNNRRVCSHNYLLTQNGTDMFVTVFLPDKNKSVNYKLYIGLRWSTPV